MEKKKSKTIATAALVMAVLCLITACGSNEIKDIPPLLQIRQMQVLDDQVRLVLRIRNPNEILIQTQLLSFDLLLDEHLFAQYSGNPDVDVVPNSAEEFELLVTPLQPQRLQELRGFVQAGEGSVAWRLDGRLELEQSIKSKLEQQGRLFPAPGTDDLLR
jgi:LEA14-like dessication related protein